MISGGAQGKQLGSALGRSPLVGVGRTRQARADLDEEARRDYARMTAEGRFEGRKYDVNDRINPATMRRRVQEIRAEDALAREEAKRQNAQAVADASAFGSERGEERRRMAEYAEKIRGDMPIDEFGQRVAVYESARNQAQEQQRRQQASNDPVQEATNAAQANPIQAASNFNSVPVASDGVGAETTRDGSLESTANYGAEAINDEIDVEEQTSTPQGEASKLDPKNVTPEQRRNIERSLSGKVKVE